MALRFYKEKSKELENLIAKMIKNLEAQAAYIKENFSDANIVEPIANGNLITYIAADKIVNFLKFLRDDQNLSFKCFIDLFGCDLLGVRTPRFEVVYNLLSLKLNNRITIKVALNDGEKINSVTQIFNGAGWFEREAFDMYGIVFSGNPDLRRILTDYDFEGHPLRKDFPLTGFKEVRYDEQQKKVVYEPVKLMQEFRNFDFEMPWEGTKYAINKDDKIKS
ncbi:MAG: NADH-quinone oxidoreductase subunit C [Rickettsiales bacterium]|nr:NADH-quinone oxidoreductase subunit C [Rickettsiales bacterium]